MNFYDFKVKNASGEEVSLKDCEDRVVLIVNVASKCGLTPQYEGLQDLYTRYKDQGLAILGFPCNQFKDQEPASNEEIQTFCRLDYGVEFPIMAKIEVNGPSEDPLYTFLKKEKPSQDDLGSLKTKAANKVFKTMSHQEKESDILWNFEKFLIDRSGNVVKRFSPATEPSDLEKDIEDLL